MQPKSVVVYSANLISQTLQGEANLHDSFSFPSTPHKPRKNGGNSVTLATKWAYVLREAADEGGKRWEETEIRLNVQSTYLRTEIS